MSPSCLHAAGQFIFEGDLRVDSLQARDPLLSDELFSFDSLELDGLSVTYEPASFHLARLGLNRPVARLVIDDTGSPNLATVLRETPEEQEPSEAPWTRRSRGEPQQQLGLCSHNSISMVVQAVV